MMWYKAVVQCMEKIYRCISIIFSLFLNPCTGSFTLVVVYAEV